MAVQPKQGKTVAEYLAIDRDSEIKHEFLDGEVFAMTGGSVSHSLIIGNMIGSLYRQLEDKPSCSVLSSETRICCEQDKSYFYPDASVVCGDMEMEDDHTLLNPIVIVEVLSKSTEAFDRGSKFARYRRIPSLKEYILIAQSKQTIESFFRNGNFWVFQEFSERDDLIVRALDLKIPLAKIYERVPGI